MQDLNVEQLRITEKPSSPHRRPPRHGKGEKFLKGPIPWPWIETAARLPGKSPLAVGLILWHLAGCKCSRTVEFCLRRATALGMSWRTASRAIDLLERAGLVTTAARPGRCLEVTITITPHILRDQQLDP